MSTLSPLLSGSDIGLNDGEEPNFLVDFDKPFASVSLAFPAPFRGLIRTTNLLERLHKERRRKQRDIGMLQSEQGCETLWYVLSRRETAKQRALLQSRW